MYTIVCYPKCSTCRRAVEWLEAHNVPHVYRDIKVDNPTADELRTWHLDSGLPLKRFYNTSGMLYRDLNIKERVVAMGDAQQYDLLSSDGMLVKRPILISPTGDVLVGFREPEWSALLDV